MLLPGWRCGCCSVVRSRPPAGQGMTLAFFISDSARRRLPVQRGRGLNPVGGERYATLRP
eukprot:9793300-Heterocapsa_arctica.AAC.1